MPNARRCPRPLSARSAPRPRRPRYTLMEMARPRGWAGLRQLVAVYAAEGTVWPAAARKAWATRRARAAQLAITWPLRRQLQLFPQKGADR